MHHSDKDYQVTIRTRKKKTKRIKKLQSNKKTNLENTIHIKNEADNDPNHSGQIRIENIPFEPLKSLPSSLLNYNRFLIN